MVHFLLLVISISGIVLALSFVTGQAIVAMLSLFVMVLSALTMPIAWLVDAADRDECRYEYATEYC